MFHTAGIQTEYVFIYTALASTKTNWLEIFAQSLTGMSDKKEHAETFFSHRTYWLINRVTSMI